MHIYVYTWLIALLQYFFECVSIHTQQYRTLSSLPNPGRSKYSMYGVCMYVCMLKAFKHLYPLPNTGGSIICVSIHIQSY